MSTISDFKVSLAIFIPIADYLPGDDSIRLCENINRTDLTEQEQAQIQLDKV